MVQGLELDEERSAPAPGSYGRSLAFLLRSVWAYPGLLLGGLALVGVSTAAALIEPRLFGWAIDEAITPRLGSKLDQYVLSLLGLMSLRAIATIAQAYGFEVLGSRVVRDLRISLFAHIQRLPMSVFDRIPSGRLLTRVTNDVASIGEMFSSGLITGFGNVAVIVGILTVLLSINPPLGRAVLAIFPAVIVAAVFFSRRLHLNYRATRAKLSYLNARLAESILGMAVISLFNRQSRSRARFAQVNADYTRANIDTIITWGLFQPTISLAMGISMSTLLWFGGRAVLAGELTAGTLVAYFTYVTALFQPIRELADKWNIFLSGMASVERVREIKLGEPVEPDSPTNTPMELGAANGLAIQFENVWFRYPSSDWVLEDFSAEIAPGQKIGIVGPTGSGKSTLLSLLLRFYIPQRGRILIAGRDIQTFSLTQLRRLFGVVQQDPFLFSGTVAENVSLFTRTAVSEAEACVITERGRNLSMGERQRLSFERAIASQPEIWMLDEASANLDSTSERQLKLRMDACAPHKTALIVAHRLATVRDCDQIWVVHRGRMSESGSHAELVKLGGLYARLVAYEELSAGSQNV